MATIVWPLLVFAGLLMGVTPFFLGGWGGIEYIDTFSLLILAGEIGSLYVLSNKLGTSATNQPNAKVKHLAIVWGVGLLCMCGFWLRIGQGFSVLLWLPLALFFAFVGFIMLLVYLFRK